MNNLLIKIKDIINDPRASALCIVTGITGSAPGKAGAKMIVYGDGSIKGTVGGGSLEKRVVEDALDCIRLQTVVMKEYNLQKDFGMTCGGAVSIYIEPLSKPSRLYIFGAGHIGKALARFAPDMDFDTYLIDWRSELFENLENLRYQQICKPYLEAAREISFDHNSYIVIVTPNHEMDEEILAAVGKKDVAYLGLIGSKKKTEELTRTFLRDNLLTQAELDRVDMPIGIKFNAITPAEIAISILAKLIDVKNSRSAQ